MDGVDISPEMLKQAERKGHYRKLIEADLTKPLPIADATYAGLTSAGTFTHGHVGPEALNELIRVLRPGAVCAIGVNAAFFVKANFENVFAVLVDQGAISQPQLREERNYDPSAVPPEGHENDTGQVVVFNRL